MQARSTYFVDAALDATFIKNIVDYFCGVKSVTAHGCATGTCAPTAPPRSRCVKGRWEASSGRFPRVPTFRRQVLDLLTEGNVCCSSTKKFTETLEEFIAERKPDT
jgi:hypothetical protein